MFYHRRITETSIHSISGVTDIPQIRGIPESASLIEITIRGFITRGSQKLAYIQSVLFLLYGKTDVQAFHQR